jgi:PPOX class probable F420-dependent enzyme
MPVGFPPGEEDSGMDFREARRFMERYHRGVVTTYQANGAAHSSIVVCGVYKDHATFVSVHGKSKKVKNLRHNPQCTILVVDENWRGWISVEGKAQLFDYTNTDTEVIRIMLREAYRACGDEDHPDWEVYDQAMVKQEGTVVLVAPERIYGQIRE